MVKRSNRRSLVGMIELPGPTAPSPLDRAVRLLADADVPRVGAPSGGGPSPKDRRPGKIEKAGLSSDGQVHRSLYARRETIALIRKIAFEEEVSAQSLYREGLLLMLQGRGYYKDKSLDDV